MRRIIVSWVAGAGLLMMLGGCLLNLPPVTLAQAQDAWAPARTVSEVVFAFPSFVCTVDNGSTPDITRLKNSAGTLFYECPTNKSSYPWVERVTFSAYPDSGSGYTISGNVTRTNTSGSEGTRVYYLSLTNPDAAANPVLLIRGSLNSSAGGETGSITFNNDPFAFTDL